MGEHLATEIRVDGHRVAADNIMTCGEVAELFRVNVKTVARWAKEGKLTSIRTPGGHRRYLKSEVEALLRGEQPGGEAQ